ncbi:hypothetical protein VNO77_39521 [Canavalia gladiata]|uniref:Uncharacterized protein n=1 Tax=Canavalia gladiata TaxID=3824 RepID=A0AAN9KAL3_CANGL
MEGEKSQVTSHAQTNNANQNVQHNSQNQATKRPEALVNIGSSQQHDENIIGTTSTSSQQTHQSKPTQQKNLKVEAKATVEVVVSDGLNKEAKLAELGFHGGTEKKELH